MADYISREAFLEEMETWVCCSEDERRMLEITKERMKGYPAADVRENARGEWAIEDCHAATYKYCCSKCKAHHRAMYDFCPSCGADMRQKDDSV